MVMTAADSVRPPASSVAAFGDAPVSSGDANVDLIVRTIVETSAPLGVLLFGSRARGDHRPDSDVDLLVVVDDAVTDTIRHAGALRMSVIDVPMSMDILVVRAETLGRMRDFPGFVYREALRDGRVLFGHV